MAEILIQRVNSRNHTLVGFRSISPEKLASRHLKDESVKGMLELMKQQPLSFAIIENSRRVLRVIPLETAAAFRH